MIENILYSLLGAIFGGAGLIGILVYYLKRYIDTKLATEEAAAKRCQDYKSRRAKIEQEIQRAQSRMNYWVFAAIKTNHTNIEDLEQAYSAFKVAEERKEELEQEIILDFDQKLGRRKL